MNSSSSNPYITMEDMSKKDIKIYAFIASHISASKRLENFMDTLSSIYRQTILPIELHVALSYTTDEEKDLEDKIKKLNHPVLRLHLENKKLSQFENYQRLSNIDNIRDDDWVMFSDDDDIWHPSRVHEYANCIGVFHDQPNVSSVSGYHCIHLFNTEGYITKLKINDKDSTPEDVDKIAAQNKLKMTMSPEGKGDYVIYCVRYRLFKDFFKMLPYTHVNLKHHQCDMLFSDFVRTYKHDQGYMNININQSTTGGCWMYYYRDWGTNYIVTWETVSQSR